MVNVSNLRRDAIVMSSITIGNIKLDATTLQDVTRNANRLMRALAADNTTRRRQTNRIVKEVLIWLWNTMVLPIYQHLAAHQGQKWRICWMPVGIMSFFPLHAAMSQDSSRLAIDLIISSYATTFKSLRFSRRKALAQPPTPLKATLVSMAETPNQGSLQFAGEEAEALRGVLGGSMAVSWLEQPTKAAVLEAVLEALGDSVVLHMSCHGIAEPDDPSSSRLLLCDWESDPLTVADLAAHRLPHARFCYLSACHAASNLAPELLDESIHLASAMQLAGFPRVVGTLWQVNDKGAMEISAMVWEELLKENSGADFSNAAEALNKATRALRDSKIRAESEGDIQLPRSAVYLGPVRLCRLMKNLNIKSIRKSIYP
jgi:CHAT domain-containing protein